MVDIKDPNADTAAQTAQLDQAVAEGGAYEVLQRRLREQGQQLRGKADALNAARLAQFGSSKMEVIGRLRIRTEHNCVARDIVQVGDFLVLGYNVFIGLKKETRIEDVFSLYRLTEGPEGYDVVAVDMAGSFLADAVFVKEFAELFAYYKNTRLLQLVVRDHKLLAAFQIGERLEDIRVFRWQIAADGTATYIDNRGERDIALPAPYDFEWHRATREMTVHGRHPHLNILDTVFVETMNGDLTIKVENNTETGLGIYREPVEDQTQSLDDAVLEYAKLGGLILLRVLPYRESAWRHLVYNTLTRSVHRIDAIGQACVQLPEDHGVVFPGGYMLQNGETRSFDQSVQGMRFKRTIRSPNGEDVLYLFYEPVDGRVALFAYNMIQRSMQPPVIGHGCARLGDGRMVIFANENDEPTRVHPMQVWQTPYTSEEHAARQPVGSGFFAKIGNPELVRGISDVLSLVREIGVDDVSAQRYQRLTQAARRLFDQYHWVEDAHCDGLAPLLREVIGTSEAVLDEYEKVASIRTQSEAALRDAQAKKQALQAALHPDRWEKAQDCVDALNAISAQRGHLLTIREYRYIDTAAISALEAELLEAQARTAAAAGEYLAGDKALQPFAERVQALDAQAQKAPSVAALQTPLKAMQALSADLDMLSELMAGLRMEDATRRTRIVEAISEIYAKLNQAKARAEQRRKTLGSGEAVAQFGAQFGLFSQSVANALASARDPERCDQELSRLLVQLEELESQFGEHERFLTDIVAKREELLDAFEAHKQGLLDERQRKAQSLADAAVRILEGLPRRTARFAGADELNAFFAGDPLILKLRDLGARLRELKDSVKADDIDAKLKGARDQAVRALRDRSELFEEGGNVIKLGPRHRFSVNTQELDLTLLPRGDGLSLHLIGTDYFAPVEDPEFETLRGYWQSGLASESPQLYRAEYLAGEALAAAEAGREGLSLDLLRQQAKQPEQLVKTLREFAAARYRDGYEKGIHDHDAALLLAALLPLRDSAGLLAHPPAARAEAMLFWASLRDTPQLRRWQERARSARGIERVFADRAAVEALRREVADAMAVHRRSDDAANTADAARAAAPGSGIAAAECFVDVLASERPHFACSKYARQLLEALRQRLTAERLWDGLQQALEGMRETSDVADGARKRLARQWFDALCADPAYAPIADYAPEAVAMLLLGDEAGRVEEIELRAEVKGLIGEHPRIASGAMAVGIGDFAARLRAHREQFLPNFQRYQSLRNATVARERDVLRLGEFKPRPLTSFVRNKLINDIYLPLIGDNLAKQMGTAGENKRSDLMGLLMLISPPGYGKTTLMEYVASRLGLIFMKINGPALGHEVRSLDPVQAPDATSRQELEKLNLALEMGNNVMLYVDDIQHTHPEFLQKFISLCDATRRIEGVWRGRTRTYDMRGKKFCVAMAGNPYTESGEVFKIPDMLANRADVYNLGDVLGGMEDAFKLSYIENCLTSNPVLAPLATRDLADLYRFVDKAEGREFSSNALSHGYSAAEISEISAILERLLRARDVVYRVNQQYIASAAQADRYRTEPPFKLQGSYRNMNKLAEKIAPVMNTDELQQLIADHYLGEAQLLTTGAEENLLKLAELRDAMSEAQTARWTQIKRDFMRNKAMGAGEADVGQRVVAQLNDLVESVRSFGQSASRSADTPSAPWQDILIAIERFGERLASIRTTLPTPGAVVDASPTPERTVTENAAPPWFEQHAQQQLQLQQALSMLMERVMTQVEQMQKTAHGTPASGRRRKAGPSEDTPMGVDEREAQLQKALEEFSDRLLGRTPR
jgi:ATPase involved in DNA repair/ATPase family associated with various cellular activities (AAA)